MGNGKGYGASGAGRSRFTGEEVAMREARMAYAEAGEADVLATREGGGRTPGGEKGMNRMEMTGVCGAPSKLPSVMERLPENRGGIAEGEDGKGNSRRRGSSVGSGVSGIITNDADVGRDKTESDRRGVMQGVEDVKAEGVRWIRRGEGLEGTKAIGKNDGLGKAVSADKTYALSQCKELSGKNSEEGV